MIEEELYDKMAHELYEDIKSDKVTTYQEVEKRYSEINKLIPFDVHVDFFGLDWLIRKKFPEELKKSRRIYKVDVKNLPQEEVEQYIRDITNKIKNMPS